MPVVLLELTVPWEDQMEEAFERKRAKYEQLVGDCQSREWRIRSEPIEGAERPAEGPAALQATHAPWDYKTAQQERHQGSL